MVRQRSLQSSKRSLPNLPKAIALKYSRNAKNAEIKKNTTKFINIKGKTTRDLK